MKPPKTRAVLTRTDSTVGAVTFTHDDRDGPLIQATITRDAWNKLGRPQRVTATIRPGNHLTGDDT